MAFTANTQYRNATTHPCTSYCSGSPDLAYFQAQYASYPSYYRPAQQQQTYPTNIPKQEPSNQSSHLKFPASQSNQPSEPILRNTRLKTCRYWAFSKQCPNINPATGVETCNFAHWDTGPLSDAKEQRGTCVQWLKNGACGGGAWCEYEHRDTGYIEIELYGINLQVADAASAAGFDTTNHEALFDLIWAARKIVFAHGRLTSSTHPRPPRHPIYPDRFRPSGIGDNTRRKRNIQEMVEPKKERNITADVGDMTNRGGGGTQEGPIAIDSDAADFKDGIKSGPPAKKKCKRARRRKAAKGAQLLQPGPSKDYPTAMWENSVYMKEPENGSNQTARANCDFIFDTTTRALKPTLSDSPTTVAPKTTLINSLATISSIIQSTPGTFSATQTRLHGLFEAYPEMQAKSLETMLRELSEALGKAHAEARTARAKIEEVVDMLNGGSTGGGGDRDETEEIK